MKNVEGQMDNETDKYLEDTRSNQVHIIEDEVGNEIRFIKKMKSQTLQKEN
jgi:hypothetical protein